MATTRKIDELEELHNFCLNKKSRTIYLVSESDEDSEIDHRIASRFIKNLDYLESISSDEIIVKILNVGGDWNDGMAIYDSIVNSPCHITTISYSYAASMSSIIIQAADYRKINKHTDFMVHLGSYEDSGEFKQVANGLKHYERANQTMINIYASRCINGEFFKDKKMKISDVSQYIREQIDKKTDWWMSAEEAKYMGFVDEVI